jgi:ankyrin repeat protein
MTHVTPLHTAAEKGFTEIVKLLLSQSARIDAKDFRGYTPLHLAAQGNFADICRILKTAGANVSAELVGSRKTPVDLTTSDAVRHILLDMKTSMSHPLQVDFIRVKYDGNNPLQVIDHLGMSMCPGRSKKDHRRDLAFV